MANKKLLAMMLIISFIATLGAISAADTSSNDTQQDTTCQASYADTTYNVQGNEKYHYSTIHREKHEKNKQNNTKKHETGNRTSDQL